VTTAVDTDVLEALRRLIARHCGIVVADTKAGALRTRLAEHAAQLGLSGLEAYLGHLTAEPPGGALWQEVFRRVTTGETYFFRNSAQLKAFTDHLLPDTLRRQEGRMFRRLRLWSAGCASGEEAYTLAILILEALGGDAPHWQPQVQATDIDADAIRTAEAAHYTGRAVSRVPRTLLLRHFVREGEGYTVAPAARGLVSCRVLNFADQAQMGAQAQMDVIFCRNVLIYFDGEFRRQVVGHLYDSLKPGGYLVIGHAESLRGIHGGFRTVRFPGTVLYQRPEG
jgi:chemotaxis protein methyltransferase CheR